MCLKQIATGAAEKSGHLTDLERSRRRLDTRGHMFPTASLDMASSALSVLLLAVNGSINSLNT